MSRLLLDTHEPSALWHHRDPLPVRLSVRDRHPAVAVLHHRRARWLHARGRAAPIEAA